MWLRNCWYVIAWDHEIPAADAPQLFTRTVLGEPVLVYRTGAYAPNGVPFANGYADYKGLEAA